MRYLSLANVTNRAGWQVRVQGIVDILPLALAVVPWGILCGSLAIDVGFTNLEAWLMSALVFAGAAQLGGLAVIASGGLLTSVAGTTSVISARHLLYSATFRQSVIHFPFWKRAVIAFLLTDEMFAVTESFKQKTGFFSAEYAIASGMTFYLLWHASTIIGIVLGKQIPSLSDIGLDFAIAATFIAMVIQNLKSYPLVIAATISFVTSWILSKIGFSQSLLAATIVGMVAGCFLHSLAKK